MSRETLGQALRRWRTARGLSLRALARLANCGKSYIFDLEQGRTRRPAPGVVAALDAALRADGELTALADAEARSADLALTYLAAPGMYPYADLAVMLLSSPEGEVAGMERRAFVVGLGHAAGLGVAAPGLALEALRQGFVVSVAEERATAAVEDWQEVVAEHGHHYFNLPPAELFDSLTVDLLALQLAVSRRSDDTALRDLRRVGALLAALMAGTTANLGRVREASRWWRCARRAADESGDLETSLWVRGREVVCAPYEGRALPTILRLAAEAESRVQRHAAGARTTLPQLYAGKAQALALAGRGDEARAALDDFRDSFADLPLETVADRESLFAYAEDRLRFTESFVYSHLGDLERADEAQRRALQLYPDSYLSGPVQIELQRALCLVRSGDIAAGVTHAHTTLAALPRQHYRSSVVDLGGTVLRAVPDHQFIQPQVREYRHYLAETCPGVSGLSRS